MSNREAAAPITAEREAMAESFYQHIAHGDDAHRAWLRRETFAWFARLSAPVAAQPAASGVDAQYVDRAMELAHSMQRRFRHASNLEVRDGGHEEIDRIANANAWGEYKTAREALRAHLSTALKGAE